MNREKTRGKKRVESNFGKTEGDRTSLSWPVLRGLVFEGWWKGGKWVTRRRSAAGVRQSGRAAERE